MTIKAVPAAVIGGGLGVVVVVGAIAVFGPRTGWLVATGTATQGVCPQIAREINAAYGPPPPSFLPSGALAPASLSTQAYVACRPSASDPTQAAIPLDADGGVNVRSFVTQLLAQCSASLDSGAWVDGGPVPPWCAPAVGLVYMPDPLPDAWDHLPDGGLPWWCDAGACGTPVLPDTFALDAGEDGGADSGAVTVDAGHEGGVVVLDAGTHEGGMVVVVP